MMVADISKWIFGNEAEFHEKRRGKLHNLWMTSRSVLDFIKKGPKSDTTNQALSVCVSKHNKHCIERRNLEFLLIFLTAYGKL